MKRKSLLFMLLALLFAPWAANAQETLTVCDGTTTNGKIPVNGLYVDTHGTTSEFIIPAETDGMDGMIGGTITKLTFYVPTPPTTWGSPTIQLYMGEVDYTILDALNGPTNFTVVATGVWDNTQSTIEVEFATPYVYGGGNLLVGTYVQINSSGYKTTNFAGVTAPSGSSRYNNGSGSGTAVAFLPKTTFTYTPGSGVICTKPTLAVSGITHNEATLTVGGGSGTYNVQYKAASATDWIDVATNTTDITFTLNGLTPLTAYDVQVQSVCEGGATSDWKTANFSTTAQAEAVGDAWSDDFEGNDCGWELVNGTCADAWVWGTATNNGGTHALYISDDSGTSYHYSHNSIKVFATKLLNFTEGKFEFSYDWNCYGESNYDFLRVALVPASQTLTAGSDYGTITTTTLPTGWIALDGGGKLNQVQTWQNKIVAVNVTAGNYYLVLAWRSDTSTQNQPPAAVDNVSITRMACEYDVTGLAVDDITTNSATLVWNNSEVGQWQVAYAANASFENATEEIVSDTTYTMTGLQPATAYYAKVRAYCGGEDFGAWSTTISFLTECVAITSFPWTENFDSYTAASGFLPVCWDRINTGTSYTTWPCVSSSNSHSTSNCLYFYTYGNSSSTNISDQYAILPIMENLAGKQINLFARGYNNQSTYTIGTITDPTDETTFTAIATQALTTTYQEFIYFVPGSTTDSYLAIRMERPNVSGSVTRGVYIDDITINLPPACPKPLALTVTNVTAHTAQLSWTSDADAWQVMVNNDTLNLIDATTNPYVLEGLADGESYTVTVRANCDVDGYSEWSNNATFITPIACPAPTGLAISEITGHTAQLNWTGNSDSYIVNYRRAAYAEGIYEEFNKSTIPGRWSKYTGLVNDVIAGNATLIVGGGWTPTNLALGEYNMRLNIFGTSCKAWLVTPEFTPDQDLTFDLALTDYANDGPIENDTLQADDRFIVLIYANNTWTILREWNNSGSDYVYNTISSTGENVTIDLSTYYGQNVKIAFYGESTVGSNGDNDLHIDNVFCGTPYPAGDWVAVPSDTTNYTLAGLVPESEYEVYIESVCSGEQSHTTATLSFFTDVACMAPTELAVTNITPTSADLSWTSIADAWEIEVSYNIPAIVTTLTADTIPFTVSDLIPETEYIVRVRGNCGDDGYSEWSTPITFTTLVACPVPFDVEVDTVTCNSATVAWTGYSDSYILNWGYGEIHSLLNVDFEDQTIPADWNNTATADTLVWTVVTDTIHNSYYMVSGNAGVASSTSEVSCAMTYTADGFIDFDAQCMGEGTSYDVCRFLIDDNVVLAKGANGSQWDHYSFAVTAGEHTFTWRYSKDSSVNKPGDHFAVDNIKMYWEEVIWQEPITTEDTEYTFTGLTPETDYFVTVQGVCGEEQTEASEMVEFTTLEQTMLTQTIELAAGSNYVSFYVETTLAELKAALAAATPTTTISIKSQTGTTTYNPNNHRWTGNITLDLGKMYIINVSEAAEIVLEGMPLDPASLSVTITGTTYLGFPFSESMTPADAFAGFAVQGDKIKSQNATCAYNRGRWGTQIPALEPGKGYKYVSSGSEERPFTYPASK